MKRLKERITEGNYDHSKDYYLLRCPDCSYLWDLQISPGFRGWIDCPCCGVTWNIKTYIVKFVPAFSARTWVH